MSKAIGLGFSGVVMIVLGRMAATERLPRNIFAGIRIPATMRSDEAWRAGHKAAASALTTAGMGPVVISAIAVARRPGAKGLTALSRIASGWMLGWVGVAMVQANRAAREVVVG